MNPETPTARGLRRCLTGRVHHLSVVIDGRRMAVSEPRPLSTTGLADDEHAGGPERALTVHPWEHYATWSAAGLEPPTAPAFGEQLTSVGLLEAEVFVGDIFRWGTAEVQISAPASPEPTVTGPAVAGRLRRSGRTGFHLRVVRPGRVGPDDILELIEIDPAGLSVAAVGLALLDGPAAAGVSPQRLLLLRDVLPADLTEAWALLMPPAAPARAADRVPAAG